MSFEPFGKDSGLEEKEQGLVEEQGRSSTGSFRFLSQVLSKT
jgi:hypothetical protein